MPRLFIWDPTEDPTDRGDNARFRQFAENAAALGATHVVISRLPLSFWQLHDPRDPHPEWASWPVWSMVQPSLFKVAVPPALEPWLPKDEAERNLALLRERGEILRENGLRAAFYGNDPMWLPEGVYEAHPEWRGAQAELLRLTRLPYFSPCIDHPEVLAMYRWSMTEICRAVPELDIFSVFTNDSAGGVCWSHSYPGDNGPSACKHRPLVDRVSGFLTAIQDGAREAGCEVAAQITGFVKFPELYRDMGLNQYADGRNAQGDLWASGIGSNSWFANHIYPVVGVPKVFSFLEETERALTAKVSRVHIAFGPEVEPVLADLLRAWQAQPTCGPASRMAVAQQVAATRVGDDHAEQLLDVWQRIERAVEGVRHVRSFGYASLMLCGPAMMRWLTMPLVPNIDRLDPTEKPLYQQYRVAKTEIEADSYHAILGTPGVTGAAAAWMARNALAEAMTRASEAAAGAEKLISDAISDIACQELTALSYSLKAFACVIQSCRNILEYEDTLASRGRYDETVTWHDFTGVYPINRSGHELRLIARAELDNVHALAKLIEEAPNPIIAIAATPEEENTFAFGPDLPAQLREKARIMLAHWHEYNEDYPAPFEVHRHQARLEGDDRP
jgi:hypothetical protein